MNPHQRGSDEDCILTLQYRSVREIIGLGPSSEVRWEIQSSADLVGRNHMKNNLRIFRLNEVYRCHTSIIQKTLQQWYRVNSSKYRKNM